MIEGKSVVAIVPARRGSKGLPLKNIRPLGGKPLLAWPIAAAKASRYVDRVIISTDCPEFAAIGVEAGADAPFLRPRELATDTATSVSLVLHALETLAAAGESYGYVVLLEPTSPLTEGDDVDGALETLGCQRGVADAIVGVSSLAAAHPAFAVRITGAGLLRPLTDGTFQALPRRQDVENLYALDGSLYISDTKALIQKNSFYHDRTLAFVTPRWKAFEVDDLVDFICIEAIIANRNRIMLAEA
ncbi:MAG TPA: acylneuraminate cytidylyltransferase family protein [Sphingomicrobium sp.]|nr:acylneuraminate cytidylyltransferase family protein [Sphingomonas sp.]HWJ38183.1 acylneuraminate cytidylyltransferase family protein [Sphingomicrobium sp.]